MNKDRKIFLKYKSQFSFIFQDKYLSEVMKNHFDNEGHFVLFIIGLLQNRIDTKKVANHLNINKDEWCELFISLYKDEHITDVYKKLEINPIVSLNQTIEQFSCFNSFILKLIEFMKAHELNTNIHEKDFKELITNVFGYLLYNSLGCNLPYDFKNILSDPDYNTKYLTILNNTRLFALAKDSIIRNCQEKINDLIVLLLGMSKQLNLDK